MNRSDSIGDLIAALAKAQAEFTPALKETPNSQFGSKYADLAANIGAVRPALTKHGIALIQLNESDLERQVASVTTSLHHGEQWISVTAEAPAVGQKGFNIQSLGTVWTYLRRYTLQGILGLASEDDDGNSAAVDNKPIAKKFAEPVMGRMDDEEYLDCLKLIKEAKTLAELKGFYLSAVALAKKAKDAAAENEFLKAKDYRKHALEIPTDETH